MHDHYCQEHDHRWKCTIKNCTLHHVQPCLICKCGEAMINTHQFGSQTFYVCPKVITVTSYIDVLDSAHDAMMVAQR